MKKVAAHYVFLPEIGYIKQSVVEIDEAGIVRNVFTLTEELESVEWRPGVIALLSMVQLEEIKKMERLDTYRSIFCLKQGGEASILASCDEQCRERIIEQAATLFPCLFYPFDFISMQPVAETQHILLK